MAKYLIVDYRWIADLVGGSWFLAGTGLMLYVLVYDGVHPDYHSLASLTAYLAVVAIPLALFLYSLRAGFTYRWTEADSSGLTVHEGYYGLFWTMRFIPRTDILAVMQHDYRAGVFAKGPCSELRVVLRDGPTVALTASNGAGRYVQKASELKQALGIETD